MLSQENNKHNGTKQLKSIISMKHFNGHNGSGTITGSHPTAIVPIAAPTLNIFNL
jgi:hypothetical protein